MTDRDPGRIPPLNLLLGFGPALLLVVLAVGAWTLPYPYGLIAFVAGHAGGAAILLFLSGVRRGLSFFTEGGPRFAQVATAIGLFVLGLGAMMLPPIPASLAMMTGYAAIAILDPIAARRGEAPAHFARLRPPQMAIFVVGAALLLLA